MDLTVTLVANAGILLEYAGTRLLIDGLFHVEKGAPFSSPPADTLERMLKQQPPFCGVDYLLFTHAHQDHFSPVCTQRFLEHVPVKGVFLPSAVSPSEQLLADYMDREGIPFTALSPQSDKVVYTLSPEISLCVLKTRHLDKLYHHVPHFCFLLSFSGRDFLVTADFDYMNSDLSCLNRRFSGAFINPLFLQALHDPIHFRGKLDAQTIIVYHVPFEGDDQMHFRRHISSLLARWPESDAMPLVLSEPLQTFSIDL